MTSRNFLGSHQIFCVNKCRTFPKNTMSLCKSQHILQLFCKKNIIIGVYSYFFQKRNAKQLQCSNCSLVICGFALVFAIDFILVFRTSFQFTDSNLPTGKLKRQKYHKYRLLFRYVDNWLHQTLDRHWQTSG